MAAHGSSRDTPRSSLSSVAEFARLIWGMYPGRCALIVVILVLAGLGEGISILSLLPLLGIALGGAEVEGSWIYQASESVLGFFGLEVGIASLLGVMVVGAFMKAALTMLAGRQVGYAAAQLGTDMRMGLIRAMIEAKWTHYASQPVGKLSNAISSEADRSSAAFLAGGRLIADLVLVLIYLIAALVISWVITLLSLGVGGVMMYVLRATVSHTWAASTKMTDTLRSLSSRFADGLQGIKPLKAMEQKDSLLALLGIENKTFHATQEKRVFHKWLLTVSTEPIVIVFLAIGFYWAITLGGIPFETLMIMGFLFARTVTKIGIVQRRFQAVISSESAFLSIYKTIKEAEAQREVLTRGTVPSLSKGITLERVSFGFRDKPVLREVSIFVPAGKLTAIIGPSGSGKTTLVDLTVGLFEPDKGRILIDDVALSSVDMAAWRKQIGYVPQDPFLFHSDVATNVSLGDPNATLEDIEEALRAAHAWEFVSELTNGVHTIVGERGMKLSGGQRQRIAIARALVRKPRLLIFDEATTALDPRTEAAVCDALKHYGDSLTVLVISHQPAFVDVAHKVYKIKDGRITEAPFPVQATG